MGIKKLQSGLFLVRARLRINGCIVQRQARLADATREQAKAALESMKAGLRAGVGGSLKVSNFGEVLAMFREKRNKVSSPDVSRCDLLARELGDVPLTNFGDAFELFIKAFRNNPTLKTGKPPCGATVNRLVEIVRAAFNLGLALGLVKTNPVSKARFPKARERARDRYLSQEERQRLFNAIEQHAPYLLPFVRYSCLVPSRKSELARLPREAYNAFTNTVYVPDSKAGIPVYKPVSDEMKDYFLHGIPAGCPWLFYRQDKDGGFHALGDFKRAFKTCVRAAGLVNVRVHDLRHVAASDLVMAGNSERAIMDIAGWRTPMLSTYWHKDSLRSAQKIVFSVKRANGCANESVAVQ